MVFIPFFVFTCLLLFTGLNLLSIGLKLEKGTGSSFKGSHVVDQSDWQAQNSELIGKAKSGTGEAGFFSIVHQAPFFAMTYKSREIYLGSNQRKRKHSLSRTGPLIMQHTLKYITSVSYRLCAGKKTG